MAGNERFRRIYPIEDQLYISGTVMLRRKDVPVVNERLRAYLFIKNEHSPMGEWMYGDCVTDSVGGFAFAMPNAWHEWNLQLILRDAYNFGVGKSGKVGVNDSRQDYRVMLDRHFEPQPRWLSQYETDTLARVRPNLYAEVPDSVFGHIEPKYKNPTETDKWLGNRRLLMMVNQGEKRFGGSAETDSMGRYALFFPDMQGEWNLRIRGPKGVDWSRWRVMLDELFAPHPRYLLADELEPKNFGLKKWKNEKGDEKWTSCFIDCNEATLAMKNSSYIPTGFYAFLGRADNRFERTTGVASPIILNVARDSAYHKYIDLELIGHDSTDPRTVCVDGPSFNGRPIVWIVNGAYRLVTGLKKEITDFEVLRPTRKSMPLYADEVKRVFITENPTAFLPYVRCSVLEKKRPVTVFVELNAHFVYDDSGLMNTSWEGFSEE